MSKSYTPGLKITKNTKVNKIRLLPMKGTILTKLNKEVQHSDIVASTKIPGNVHMVNVARELNIEPKKIKEVAKVEIDHKVKKGTIIAQNSGLFGLFKSEVKSPIDGFISNISEVTGQIIISEPMIPIEVNAYIKGKVTEIFENEGVRIETNAALVQGIIGIGKEQNGIIKILSNRDLESDSLDIKDSIVVIDSYINLETYRKIENFGAIGIIAGGFDYEDLSNLIGKPLGVAITGNEKIKSTLVITEGFGKINMSKSTFDLLKNFSGYNASINGATQIRAGVMRPEIIIPITKENSNGLDDTNIEDSIISIGSKIRIIREPHFGKIGKVTDLPFKPIKLETQTKARVAEVELNDGKKYLVPRSNLEVILED